MPAIGVATSLERLGQLPDGTIAAPDHFNEAGWFASGTVPGQLGPAVIVGHVDSVSGPAVFYRLDQLRPGDAVEVVRANGSIVEFRVTVVEQVPKAGFPADQIYGPVPDAELRLITCGGTFDDQTGHYRSNVVIFAVLANTQS